MRVLLASSAEKGHLNPLVGVAQHLLAAGHQVGWLTLPEPAPQLDGLGVEVLHLERAPPAPPHVTGGAALARLVDDPDQLERWIRSLLVDAVPDLVEPVRRTVARFAPDVAALDGMLYPAVIACHLESVPWAGVSSALTLIEVPGLDLTLLRHVRALASERAGLFARHGLDVEFRTCEAVSPRLNVVFATPALVGDAPLPPRTHLVGPSRPLGLRGDETGFDWSRLDSGLPLVYVSFGSQISWQPEAFRIVAEAAAPLDVQLLITCGELAGPGFETELPGRVVSVDYAPQLEVLPRAAAFVSHGGANSVMEGLSHGVPLLLVPVCNDQFLQAHFVARAGAGRAIPRRELDPAGCRRALAALLTDGPERRGAQRIARSYRAADGAAEAARLVAGLAG